MNWIQEILEDQECPKCGQTKLLQTKIDRKLAENFKVMCVRLGKTQRQVIEDWMEYMLEQYELGRDVSVMSVMSGNLTPAGEAHG